MCKTLIHLVIWMLLFSPSLALSNERLTFSTYQGSPVQGLSAVILDEAYGYLNIPIRVKTYAHKTKHASDGEVSQTIDLENTLSDYIRIQEPVNYFEETVFTKDTAIHIHSWDSLSSHLFGIALGSKHTEEKTKHMQRVMAPNYRQLFAMLNQNRLELIVSPLIEGLFAMRQTRLTHLNLSDRKLSRVELYHYLHRKHATLAPHIEKALKVMRENGRIESLREQFIKRLREI